MTAWRAIALFCAAAFAAGFGVMWWLLRSIGQAIERMNQP